MFGYESCSSCSSCSSSNSSSYVRNTQLKKGISIEKDYIDGIALDEKQLKALYAKRQQLIKDYQEAFTTSNNELAQKKLQEIAETEQAIIKQREEQERKKDELMELRLKPYYDAQKKLADVIGEYQTLQKLLGDTESFFNDDGSFTTNGLANITLLQESVDATKTTIANATKQLDILQQHYANGNLSEKEYKERTEEAQDTIRKSAEALAEYKQQMINLYETQVKMENDLLVKNIDLRLSALDAKERFYEFDKTIKKKNKDIESLKSQIAALSGTTNKYSLARLEKLKAELAEAESDMDDTVYQHEQEMKKYGYQQLQTDAETALDNTLDALKKNTDFQQAVIGNMLDAVKSNYGDVYSHLNNMIKDHGIVVSETYKEMIGSVVAFNEAAQQFTPPDISVQNQDTSHIQIGDSTSDNILNDVVNSNEPKTKRDLVLEWWRKLKDFNGEMPEKRSKLAEYIYNSGKIANRYQFQELADILGVKTSGAKDYDNWGKKGYKNKILAELKKVGAFAHGGTVKKAMSAQHLANMLQRAVISKGDSGFISVNPGETILTAAQTGDLVENVKQLSADMYKMQELVNSSFNVGKSKLNTGSSNVTNNVDNSMVFNINVERMANDMDIQHLADVLQKKIGRDTKADLRKLR